MKKGLFPDPLAITIELEADLEALFRHIHDLAKGHGVLNSNGCKAFAIQLNAGGFQAVN